MIVKEVTISKPSQAKMKKGVKRLAKVQGVSICCEMLKSKPLMMLKGSLMRKFNMMRRGGYLMLMQENRRMGKKCNML